MRAFDDGDWDGAEKAAKLIGMSLDEYQIIYLNAIKKCDSVYNELSLIKQ